MADTLIEETSPVLTIGRSRTQHSPRVLIEGQCVVIRTRCGIDPLDQGFTERHGYITCDECAAQKAAS